MQADEQDCQDAIAFIQPDRVLTVNIKGAVLASEQALREAGIELSDFVRGNEKARERMKAQYSIAGMTHGVVVGTDHAAEAITGFSLNTATAARTSTLFSASTNVRANSFWPIWGVRSTCIKTADRRS